MRGLVWLACAALCACGGGGGKGGGGGGGSGGSGGGGGGGAGGGGNHPFVKLYQPTMASGSVSLTGTETSVASAYDTTSSSLTVTGLDQALLAASGGAPHGQLTFDGSGYDWSFTIPITLSTTGATGTLTQNGNVMNLTTQPKMLSATLDFHATWTTETDLTLSVPNNELVPDSVASFQFDPAPVIFTGHTADIESGMFTLNATMPVTDSSTSGSTMWNYQRMVDLHVSGQVQ